MSTDAKRYYAVLGVEPQASAETIRVAFRQRAKELHPDAESGDATTFILLKRAYDTLCNPVDRAAYDRFCSPARPVNPPPPRPAPYWPAPPPMSAPPLPRLKPARRSGVRLRRYVIAFIIMAAISLGGVQAMISLIEAPPSIQTRPTGRGAESRTEATSAGTAPNSATEPSPAPGSTKSGFWDAGPTPTRPK